MNTPTYINTSTHTDIYYIIKLALTNTFKHINTLIEIQIHKDTLRDKRSQSHLHKRLSIHTKVKSSTHKHIPTYNTNNHTNQPTDKYKNTMITTVIKNLLINLQGKTLYIYLIK